MKKLLNNPEDVVEEMIQGILLAHSDVLVPVPGDGRAIVRKQVAPNKVGLVIGGGSGHEPAFLGYVGEGLADGVALGNIFASPAPDPIVSAARAVSTGRGVLLIYGNYAGDCMNFDMARELLEAEGIETANVVVADDVASAPRSDLHRRRGIAGEIIVYKAAGAWAAQGRNLADVARIAQKAADRTRSIGVAWTPCTIPQTGQKSFKIGDQEMEIGLGVHGEPGVRRVPMMTATEAAQAMVKAIVEDLDSIDGPVAVLVNGLGSTSLMELYILYRSVAPLLQKAGASIRQVDVGEFITSQEMGGCSLTVTLLDEELAMALAAPCKSLGWERC